MRKNINTSILAQLLNFFNFFCYYIQNLVLHFNTLQNNLADFYCISVAINFGIYIKKKKNGNFFFLFLFYFPVKLLVANDIPNSFFHLL